LVIQPLVCKTYSMISSSSPTPLWFGKRFFGRYVNVRWHLHNDQRKIIFWHPHRLRELSPCYVRSVFTFRWILTFATPFRLNSRGYLRNRANDNNSIDGSSVRQSKAQYRPNGAGSTTIAFVHQETTTDFAGETHDYGMELELGKPVRILHPSTTYRNWKRLVTEAGNRHFCFWTWGLKVTWYCIQIPSSRWKFMAITMVWAWHCGRISCV